MAVTDQLVQAGRQPARELGGHRIRGQRGELGPPPFGGGWWGGRLRRPGPAAVRVGGGGERREGGARKRGVGEQGGTKGPPSPAAPPPPLRGWRGHISINRAVAVVISGGGVWRASGRDL